MNLKDETIVLSGDEEENYITIDNEDFLLLNLSNDYDKAKGSSANLFILSDPSGETEDRVIKISKASVQKGKLTKRYKRFEREIRAFKEAKKHQLRNVIEYHKSGEVYVDQLRLKFPYIIMEKADSDLPSYLEEKRFDFTPSQKLTFCVGILNGIKQLHKIGIYHRDIKHDNILVVNGEFKIGDLGLVDFQNDDFEMDRPNEKVGPFGWLSPEATNKMLTNEKDIIYQYDCDINHHSDVFQLGKLFWYVFQGNLPIGQILLEDYMINEDDIYQVIFSMLQYKKSRRLTIEAIEAMLAPLKIKYGV
jgi:serine/threonine protein kinase